MEGAELVAAAGMVSANPVQVLATVAQAVLAEELPRPVVLSDCRRQPEWQLFWHLPWPGAGLCRGGSGNQLVR